METYKINTIDLQAKEWFDKTNANSYFSAVITLNFGLKDQKTINIPFQYGYGLQYEYTALHQLQTENFIPLDALTIWQYTRENNIVLRSSKKDKCLKSEVKNFVAY